MSPFRLVLRSLLYHWRANLAVAAGVVAGSAVLTGALLVGDSMRGSLRHLALDRLGRVDEILVAQHFFRAELADELAAGAEFQQHFSEAVPAIILRANLQNADDNSPRRAGGVNLIGYDPAFWQLAPDDQTTQQPVQPPEHPSRGQIILNRPLAYRLGIERPGDEVILSLPQISSVPADSPLGRKTETVRRSRYTVSRIVPAEGMGAFSTKPSQHLPLNAYLPIKQVQRRLGQPGRVNAILVAGENAERAPSRESEGVLSRLLRPTLDDFGLRVEKTPLGYFSVTSERMVIEEQTEAAINDCLKDYQPRPALTYLANTIACGERQIPYSTVTAVEFASQWPGGPLVDLKGEPIRQLADDRIVLNSWAAEDLRAEVGQTVSLTFFEPESTEGQLREITVDFKVAAIAQLAGAADDPAFTPEVPGVTDQSSISDWDPPFPFDTKRIRKKDEQYWDDRRAAPKAFVSLAAGRKLWGSRFGRSTSLRIGANGDTTLEDIRRQLQPDPTQLGFVFQPVKRQALDASKGATPFDVLFLLFSMFVIGAAVMLVALLFRLGIDQRAEQIGIFLAVGIGRRRTFGMLALEGLIVSAVASLVGVGLGIGYAALMLTGLRTWWLAAVVTPFLRLHFTALTPLYLSIGYFSGVMVAFGTIAWSLYRTRRMPVRRLLAGQPYSESHLSSIATKRVNWLAWVMLIGAVGLGLFASRLGENARAGAFFGAGSMVLAACLLLVRSRLKAGATGPAVAVGGGNLMRMALRNAARNPMRSTLSIGLVGATSFLIIAISAFYLDPSQRVPELGSGDGGFSLVAQCDQPVYQDINTPDGRFDLGFAKKDSEALRGATVHGVRVKPGDDASCLNLYQARQPRILGVPDSVIARGGFAWTKTAASSPEERENPWLLLNRELPPDEDGTPRVPVVIDMATAIWALHLYGGPGETLDVTDRSGRTVRMELVGLLKNSILQGDLITSETALLRHFPEVDGYRFFLVENPPEKTPRVAGALEGALGDRGFFTETTGDRLAAFLVVQNTYLSTFQSLGGLGLLLGTFGLAAVQLRAVFERRHELALLRATGFRRGTLAWMVMLENGLLLLAGLGCGVTAAIVAVLPHLLAGAASIPWPSLVATLLLVLLTGLVAGLAAVRATLRAPLVAALRGE
jgi:putative ABC transport system permease protein